MRTSYLAALLVLAVVAVAGGWYFGIASTPPEQTTLASSELMFPGLAARLQDATKVEITHQGATTVIEKRPDGAWGIASMHDYPVQQAKLRGLLTGLTELRLTEPRTSDPAEFRRLGVEDPNAKGAAADLLRVIDTAGKPILAVIVGHRRVRGQANVPDEVFVRRPDENQSWMAEGSLQVDAEASTWLDRDLLNIGHDRLASVTVTRADAAAGPALVFGQVGGRFTLTQPAEHPKLEDYKVDDVARGLEQLTFQSVKADADAPGSELGQSMFTTSDGLGVKVTMLRADKDLWARFAVTGTDKAKPEAERLGRRVAGWTYQIGAWKQASLLPSLDDLKAAEPARSTVQAASPAAGGAALGSDTALPMRTPGAMPTAPTSEPPTPAAPTPTGPTSDDSAK